MGCEYKIVTNDKLLVVKKGETELGRTKDKEFVVNDLMNGKYSYAVIPVYDNEEGIASEEATVEVDNNWVVAPSLVCEAGADKEVILKWEAPEEVEKYHVIVSVGSGSLLRFVNLDYKKYQEFDVDASAGSMEYSFTYDEDIESEGGVKLKFEIYGLRKAADGSEQKSATSKQVFVLE